MTETPLQSAFWDVSYKDRQFLLLDFLSRKAAISILDYLSKYCVEKLPNNVPLDLLIEEHAFKVYDHLKRHPLASIFSKQWQEEFTLEYLTAVVKVAKEIADARDYS